MGNTIDYAVLHWFSELDAPAWLNAFMVFWTNHIQPAYVVLAVVLMLFRPSRKTSLTGAAAIVLSVLSVEFCWKHIFERVRPYDQFDFVRLLVEPETSFSFPSGHTSMAFAAALAMSYRSPPQVKAVLLCCAATTAFSRLYVGVHYLTDVLAGAVSGTVCALLAILIIRFFERRGIVNQL